MMLNNNIKMDIINLGTSTLQIKILKMLVEHFEYSIHDVEEYNELTLREQDIISEELFNRLIKK